MSTTDDIVSNLWLDTIINEDNKKREHDILVNTHDRLKGSYSKNLYGQMFYKLLIANGFGALQDKVPIRKGFTISCDNKYVKNGVVSPVGKIFTYFDDVEKLWGYCVAKHKNHPEHRNYYEVIENKCKIYFDIDMKDNLDLADKMIYEVLNAIKIEMLTKVSNYNHFDHTLIFTSHSEIKKSFHVIIDGFFFENNQQVKQFYKNVKRNVPEYYHKYLDSAVYTKNRSFRMYKSQKLGSNRPKEITKEYDTFIPKLQKDIFYTSLITNISKCVSLTPYEIKSDSFQKEEILDEYWEQIVAIWHNYSDYKSFKLIPGKTRLDRIGHGYCPIHERIHEGTNGGFISVSKGMVYFKCMGSGDTERFLLGILKPIITEVTVKESKMPLAYSCLSAQQNLFTVAKDLFKYCGGNMYSFDKNTGMFIMGDIECKSVLSQYQDCFKTNDNGGNWFHEMKRVNEIVSYIKVAALDNNWLNNTNNTSRFKLLYKDGIYDMKTRVFTKGFDPKIVFHGRINHNFPEFKQEYVDDVWLYLYSLSKDPIPMLHALRAALAADPTLKDFILGPGDSNSGKSSLVMALKSVFGDYVGDFSAENLAYNSSSADNAAQMRPFFLSRYKRILCSSEVKMDITFNGNAIKKCSSGGDGLVGRFHCNNETTFYPHFVLFAFLNDVPTIKPYDDAVEDRCKVLSFDYIFPKEWHEGLPENHLPRDPYFQQRIESPEFISGFTHILLNFDESTFKGYNQELKDDWFDSMRTSNISQDIFDDLFVIGNENDFIAMKDLNKIIKDNVDEKIMSAKKFKEMLKTKGAKDRRNSKQRGYNFLKLKSNNLSSISENSFNQMIAMTK